MFEVIYYSLTGNTKKVADAIATELGVAAENVKTKDKLAEDSFVFLGAGLYGPLRGWGLKRFIDRNNFDGRKVALFGTSGEGKGKEVGALEEAVAAKGAEIGGRFFCRGKFLFFINRKHPTSKDLGNARIFAREMAKD
jgi:flavodoxin I